MTTIEGLRDHPMVHAFVRADALQCGFCTPGQIVSAVALVDATPKPTTRGDPARDGRATSAAAARIRRSRRRFARGKTDPHREGGRRPVRGGLARRRGGRARAVAGRAAHDRRAAGDAHRRARAGARRSRLHRRPDSCPGCCTPRCCARRTRTRASTRIDLAPALAHAGRARGARPGRDRRARRGVRLPGRRGRGRLRRHVRAGARRARRDRRRLRAARGAARSRRGGRARAAASASRACASAATSSAASRRPTSSSRRVPHAGRAAQLDGDAPGRRAVGRRHARRLHLDAVHLGRPRRGRARARPAGRQGARRLRVHGRRLRLEEQPRRVHVRRGRAREADRPAGALRAHAPRGEHRRRQPQRDDPAAHGRRASDGTIDRARRRVRRTRSAGRLDVDDRGPDADALRVRQRAHDDVRREAEHAADEGVPRARLRRGDVRARVPARRARREARPRPARAAAPQPRARRERRHAVLVEAPARSATAAPSRTGSGGTRCARAPTRRGKHGVGMASQIWYGGGGPPSYAWMRVGSDGRARSSRRCRTSAPARAPRWRRSPPRSSASRSTTSRSSLGDSARGPYASISAGSSTLPSIGPAVRAAAADAKRQIVEIAAQRYDSRSACSTSATGRSSPPTATSRPARGGRRPARERADPRQGRARPEPDRDAACSRSASRSPRSRSTSRPARSACCGSPRVHDVGRIDQPARRVEPGRGRDHPGDRPHALRGAAARPARRARSSRRRSTRTGCRRSPTCRRSSASSSTSRTST